MPLDASEDMRICELEQEVERLRDVLGSLISWIGQSENAPLSRKECERLLLLLDDVAWRILIDSK